MTVKTEVEKKPKISESSMKITVSRNGPYLVTGGVPLIVSEISMMKKAIAETGGKLKDTL